MATAVHTLNTKSLTLKITLPRMFGFRMWLTAQILKLAGLVSPTTIAVEFAGEAGCRSYMLIDGVEVPLQWAVDDGVTETMRRVDVILDGVTQEAVVAYDVDAGFVRRHVLANGLPQLNATKDAALTETVYGTVGLVLAR